MPSFLKKSWVIGLAIWIVVGSLAAYIRLYPAWGHMWSPTHETATMAVVYKIKQTFMEQLHAQYPQMPVEQASQLATAKLNDTLHHEHSNLMRAIEQTNDSMFRQRGLPDNIYLLESDPFYYFHLTENIVNTGHMATQIKGHQYFDVLMKAPFGYWQPLSLHPYVGFVVFKISQFVKPTIKLMEGVSYTPVILSVLLLGAFIWCGRLLSLSFPALGIAVFYFAMLPVFLKRSSLGWYDTDPYNLLFTLLFLGITFKSFSASKARDIIFWACLQSINLIAFSLIWQGWVFLFFMTLITAGATFGFGYFIQKNKDILKERSIYVAVFLATIIAVGVAIYGIRGFFTFFTEGGSELGKFTNKGLNLWPNLFMEVGELKRSTLTDVLGDTGGPVFLMLAILGISACAYRILKDIKNRAHATSIVVLLLMLVTAVMTVKATRFVIFMIIPLALCFGFALETIFTKINQRFKMAWGTIVLGIMLIGWNWIECNNSIRNVLTPIFNDAWNDNLTALRTLTPNDAIINTWWPPGHFIKAISHRRVMFDGASLSEDQTGYWMAKALLSNDEREANGIIRMLNRSGNTATEFLINKGLKVSQAVDILTTIASQSIDQARVTLANALKATDATYLLSLTHGAMPHSYLLIYNEIVEENIGLVFVGRRDFRKIEAINADPKLLSQVPKATSHAFIDYLWDIAGGPSKFSEAFNLVNKTTDGMLFAPGLLVSNDFKNAIMNSDTYGHGSPQSIVYLKDGEVIEQKLSTATLGYSILVYEQDGQPMCRLMDTSLANSLMMKLYFFNGQGLQHFKLIKSSSDLTGRTQIKTFQVL